MSGLEQEYRRCFTDLDGTFDGVLARVQQTGTGYTSESPVSGARYTCLVKIRYNRELMVRLAE
ncbi:MAG: hypothetical protein QXS20_09020, partial [Candidatus Thorarchaeota archaeon]